MGLSGTVATAALETNYTEHHLHNRERWFGIAAPQTATDWGEEASIALYRAISGNGAFGADANDEAQVVGTDDTPATVGHTTFDFHRILVADQSSVTAYVLRIVWGTGTMADAETAGQYTDIAVIANAALGPMAGGAPFHVMMPRVAVDTKVWVRAKNATNNATIDFLVGLHEYS